MEALGHLPSSSREARNLTPAQSKTWDSTEFLMLDNGVFTAHEAALFLSGLAQWVPATPGQNDGRSSFPIIRRKRNFKLQVQTSVVWRNSMRKRQHVGMTFTTAAVLNLFFLYLTFHSSGWKDTLAETPASHTEEMHSDTGTRALPNPHGHLAETGHSDL